MMDSRFRHIIIIALSGIIAILSIIQLGRLRINSNIESYLPDYISSKIHYDSIQEIFGTSEPLLIIFQANDLMETGTLEQLKLINDSFVISPHFSRINSLFESTRIRGEEGLMIVEALISKIPSNENEKDSLTKHLLNDDQVGKHFLSTDAKHCLLMANPSEEFSDLEIIDKTKEILKSFDPFGKSYISGPLYMRTEANSKITKDFIILLPLGLLIMLLFLMFSFRQKRAVFLPFGVVCLSILLCLGLMPLFGWELSIIGIIIPVMMIAIANDYGIHYITKYQELSITQSTLSEKSIVKNVTSYLRKPVIMTGLTTIIGILGLCLHIMFPARQMGVIASIGIAFALLLSLTLIPALLITYGKKSRNPGYMGLQKNLPLKSLNHISKWIYVHPKRIILFFAIPFLLTSIGIIKLDLARDFDNIMHKNHDFSIAKQKINEFFGGSKLVAFYFEGDMMNPDLLSNLNDYEREIKKIEGVGNAHSLSTLVTEISKALNSPGDKNYNQIPENRMEIAQYLELYNMDGDPEFLETFVDFNYEKSLMTVQIKSEDQAGISEQMKKIMPIVSRDSSFQFAGSYSLIEGEMSKLIGKGQLYSLIFAFLSICLVLGIYFKSVSAGLISGLPLLFTVVFVFGLMGWVGIRLDIVTALISSVSIGLGVDYTIHILWRIKQEIINGNNLETAIRNCLMTTGYGVAINALSVIIGFSVLFLSSFTIIRVFALLIILSIICCLLISLIIIPVSIKLIKPNFIIHPKT